MTENTPAPAASGGTEKPSAVSTIATAAAEAFKDGKLDSNDVVPLATAGLSALGVNVGTAAAATAGTAAATTAGAAASTTAGAASAAGGTSTIATIASVAADVLKDGKVGTDDIVKIAGVGLSALGVNMDATGAAGSSPLGELLMLVVSKIKFLSKPLEKLYGSPEAVMEQAGKWEAFAKTYQEAGADHAQGKSDLKSWTGQAAITYDQVFQATQLIFEPAAQGAIAMANSVKACGELVAIVRKFIWDLIAKFLQAVVQSALTALASAVPTFGASITAFAAWFVGKTATYAAMFANMLAKLLAKAKEVAKKLKEDAKKLEDAKAQLTQMKAALSSGASATARTSVRIAPAGA